MEHTPKVTPEFLPTVMEVRHRLAIRYGEDVAQEASLRMFDLFTKGRLTELDRNSLAGFMYVVGMNIHKDSLKKTWEQAPLAPAGWYPDPFDLSGSCQRRWTGTRWTDEVRDPSGRPVSSERPISARRRQHMQPAPLDQEVNEMPTSDDDPFAREDEMNLLNRILRALPPLEAEVLRLAILERRNDAEVGREIGRTARAAQTLRVRAIARAARIAPFLLED